MTDHRLSTTKNRSVVGIMNEFTHLGDVYRSSGDAGDLVTLSLRLAGTPCSPLYGRHVSPDRCVGGTTSPLSAPCDLRCLGQATKRPTQCRRQPLRCGPTRLGQRGTMAASISTQILSQRRCRPRVGAWFAWKGDVSHQLVQFTLADGQGDAVRSGSSPIQDPLQFPVDHRVIEEQSVYGELIACPDGRRCASPSSPPAAEDRDWLPGD